MLALSARAMLLALVVVFTVASSCCAAEGSSQAFEDIKDASLRGVLQDAGGNWGAEGVRRTLLAGALPPPPPPPPPSDGSSFPAWIIAIAIVPEFVIGGLVMLYCWWKKRKAAKLGHGASGAALLAPAPVSDTFLGEKDISIDAGPIVLGEGRQAKVVRGTLFGSRPVAVRLVLADQGPDGEPALPPELAILRSIDCGEVVAFLGACAAGDELRLACELMEGGDLQGALQGGLEAGGGGGLRWAGGSGRIIALDVARGLCYLHARRIVHLALKPSNILLSADKAHAKIGDVGFSHIMGQSKGAVPLAPDPLHAAPEQLAGGTCGTKADMYSMGVLLWALVTGEAPVRGAMRSVSVPGECSQAVADAIARCLAEVPAERPTAEEMSVILSEEGDS